LARRSRALARLRRAKTDGDSGGPHFLGAGADETNIVVSVTVTGDVWCKATDATYRLDTDSARSFLDDYVTLP
jgi:hypothetical protein